MSFGNSIVALNIMGAGRCSSVILSSRAATSAGALVMMVKVGMPTCRKLLFRQIA